MKLDSQEVMNNAKCGKLNQLLRERTEELDSIVREKDSKMQQLYESLNTLQGALDEKIKEEVNREECIKELRSCVESYETLNASLTTETKGLITQLQDTITAKQHLQTTIDEKTNEITRLENKLKDMERDAINAVNIVKEDCQSKIIELEALKNKNLDMQNNFTIELAMLNDKLIHERESKDGIIQHLTLTITDKDRHIAEMNARILELSQHKSKLDKELTETKSALEVERDDFLSFKAEHDTLVTRNNEKVSLKDQRLKELENNLNELNDQKLQLEKEKQLILNEFNAEKKVCVKLIICMCFIITSYPFVSSFNANVFVFK